MKAIFCMTLLMFAAAMATAPSILARDVILGPGESVQVGSDRVTCGTERGEADAPLRTTECQHWDEYSKTCLYEKAMLSFDGVECVEDCQYWDSYNNKCLYATQCEFSASQRVFVRTTCADFDSYDQACRRTTQEKIAGRHRGR